MNIRLPLYGIWALVYYKSILILILIGIIFFLFELLIFLKKRKFLEILGTYMISSFSLYIFCLGIMDWNFTATKLGDYYNIIAVLGFAYSLLVVVANTVKFKKLVSKSK
tara:strand:- start:449 stop:775 length:327 start_codon:yes stop_codon:yes gene_type:complete